jgi:hypothetical protein
MSQGEDDCALCRLSISKADTVLEDRYSVLNPSYLSLNGYLADSFLKCYLMNQASTLSS